MRKPLPSIISFALLVLVSAMLFLSYQNKVFFKENIFILVSIHLT